MGFYDKDSGNKTDWLPIDVRSIMEKMDKTSDLSNHDKRTTNSPCLNMRLRYNRCIPKPIAQLSPILELLNDDIKLRSPKSVKGRKDQCKQKRIRKKKSTKRKLQTIASIEESPQEDIVSDNISKNSALQNVEQSSAIPKAYFKVKSSSDRFYSNDPDHNILNLPSQQRTKVKNSNGNETDSEFEKFIKNNKINFKEVPKRKQLKRKRKMPKRVPKYLRESISIESVSEHCNLNFQDVCANAIQVDSNEDKSETTAPQNVRSEENNKIKLKKVSNRKSKLRKKSISIENIPEDCHLSKDFSDKNCQDIFGSIGGALNNDKSEAATVQTCSNEYANSRIELKPNICDEHIIKESHKSDIAESGRNKESSKTEIDKNSGDSNIISTIQNDCPYLKNSVLKFSAINLKDGISRKDSGCQEAGNTAYELPFNIPNSSNVKNSSTYQGSNNQTSSEDVNVIDLCDSDAEDENTETTQHFRSLHQKQNGLELCEIQRFTPIEVDSGIEIIDIKPISNSEQILNSKKFISSNLETSKNSNKYNEEKHSNKDNNYIEHSAASAMPHVKIDGEIETESFTSDGIVNDLPLPVIASFDVKKERSIELRRKMCENNSPVYVTDICKVFTTHENWAGASYEHLDNCLISVNSSIQSNRLHVTEGTEFNANYQSCVNDTVKNEVKGEEHIRAVDSVSVKGENAIDIPERKIEKCSELNKKNSYFYFTCNSADVNAQNNFSTQTLYNRESSGSKSTIEIALCDENSKIPEVNILLGKYNMHYETYQNIIMAQKDFKTMLAFFEQEERKQEGNIIMTQNSLETRLEFLEQQERNTLLAILTELRGLL